MLPIGRKSLMLLYLCSFPYLKVAVLVSASNQPFLSLHIFHHSHHHHHHHHHHTILTTWFDAIHYPNTAPIMAAAPAVSVPVPRRALMRVKILEIPPLPPMILLIGTRSPPLQELLLVVVVAAANLRELAILSNDQDDEPPPCGVSCPPSSASTSMYDLVRTSHKSNIRSAWWTIPNKNMHRVGFPTKKWNIALTKSITCCTRSNKITIIMAIVCEDWSVFPHQGEDETAVSTFAVAPLKRWWKSKAYNEVKAYSANQTPVFFEPFTERSPILVKNVRGK
jgi:hypothetical protein